jgi:oligopeptide transport system substrate-binding protein
MCGWKISRRSWALYALWGLWGLCAGCSKRDPAADSSQTLRLSQRNEPATLDPQLASLPDEYFTARALFEGLTTPDPAGGAPLPGVAERWEASADGLTWTFRLRAGARWSNGDPVTAHDFVWSFRRILTPALGAAKAPLHFVVKNARAYLRGETKDFATVGFAAPDARTLVVTLEHPAPYLPALAATGAWLPVHPPTLERHGLGRDSRWSEPGNLVGNGPYSLDAWRRATPATGTAPPSTPPPCTS